MEKNIKVLLMCCLLFASQFATSQKTEVFEIPKVKKNIVKINLSSLIFLNASLQYERVIKTNMSVALGISLMPKTQLPFAGTLQDQYGENEDAKRAIENTKLGNFSITPEFRWYVGQKGAPNGFYLAPFVRYNRMTFDQIYEFNTNNGLHRPNITGTINNIGGGLMIGAQWTLSKNISLDWWILGGIYGSTKGDFTGYDDLSTMTPQEKIDLKRDIEDVPIPLSNINATIYNDRIDVTVTGPYVGLRAFGLALGYKF
jgi:hypothetical protein